jgi:hypothetical protein
MRTAKNSSKPESVKEDEWLRKHWYTAQGREAIRARARAKAKTAQGTNPIDPPPS